MVEASHHKGYSNQRCFGIKDGVETNTRTPRHNPKRRLFHRNILWHRHVLHHITNSTHCRFIALHKPVWPTRGNVTRIDVKQHSVIMRATRLTTILAHSKIAKPLSLISQRPHKNLQIIFNQLTTFRQVLMLMLKLILYSIQYQMVVIMKEED